MKAWILAIIIFGLPLVGIMIAVGILWKALDTAED